jgi:predicted nuclease of predicted toxin-antitoxin system
VNTAQSRLTCRERIDILLLDENLSYTLAARLADLFPNSSHLREFSLLSSPDVAIWAFALQNEFTIVTTNTDFFETGTNLGPSPPRMNPYQCLP